MSKSWQGRKQTKRTPGAGAGRGPCKAPALILKKTHHWRSQGLSFLMSLNVQKTHSVCCVEIDCSRQEKQNVKEQGSWRKPRPQKVMSGPETRGDRCDRDTFWNESPWALFRNSVWVTAKERSQGWCQRLLTPLVGAWQCHLSVGVGEGNREEKS